MCLSWPIWHTYIYNCSQKQSKPYTWLSWPMTPANTTETVRGSERLFSLGEKCLTAPGNQTVPIWIMCLAFSHTHTHSHQLHRPTEGWPDQHDHQTLPGEEPCFCTINTWQHQQHYQIHPGKPVVFLPHQWKTWLQLQQNYQSQESKILCQQKNKTTKQNEKQK